MGWLERKLQDNIEERQPLDGEAFLRNSQTATTLSPEETKKQFDMGRTLKQVKDMLISTPIEYWSEIVPSPYGFGDFESYKGQPIDVGGGMGIRQPFEEARGYKTLKDVASTAMIWQGITQLADMMQAQSSLNKYGEFKTKFNQFLSKYPQPVTERQSQALGGLEDFLWSKLSQPTYDVYGGLPVRFSGQAAISKIENALSKTSQQIWQVPQLIGFLQGKVPQIEIDELLKPLLQGRQTISTPEITRGIQEKIPQVEEVVKGGRSKREVFRDRAAQDMFQKDFDRLTEKQKKEVDTEINIAASQGDLDIEEFTQDKELKSATKFSQYQLPGGENYREVLIKAPTPSLKTMGRDAYNKAIEIQDQKGGAFTSSHWDEPNVLAHLRLNDRTTPDGKKVLFLEELQSDWAKEARKDLQGPEAMRLEGGYPYHPLLKNWQELVLKRVIKEAVGGGYDYISWTTGEQQAERYDLSKHVDSIWYRKEGDTIRVSGQKGNDQIIRKDVSNKELDGLVGKEVAQRIRNNEGTSVDAVGTKSLTGEALRIGGEWAKNLYDRQIPNILKDLTGGNIVDIQLDAPLVHIGTLRGTGGIVGKQMALKITPQTPKLSPTEGGKVD